MKLYFKTRSAARAFKSGKLVDCKGTEASKRWAKDITK